MENFMEKWNENNIRKIKDINTTDILFRNNVPIIQYKSLSDQNWLVNGFSTRLGGVSEGIYETMNLSFTVGDNETAVKENFNIFGNALGVLPADMVYSHQTHTVNVLRVTSEHKGMGILRERNFSDIDGLITDEPGVCLVTSYADCVPLYFADPSHKAIGLSHSGWRGTVGNICQNTVKKMQEEFGTKPEELIACIGPSICVNCYEVNSDVAEQFRKAYDRKQADDILISKENGKFQLDLHKANYYNMVNCGILPENISMPDFCTCCSRTWLHSHRGSGGQRGGLCAFLEIRKKHSV